MGLVPRITKPSPFSAETRFTTSLVWLAHVAHVGWSGAAANFLHFHRYSSPSPLVSVSLYVSVTVFCVPFLLPLPFPLRCCFIDWAIAVRLDRRSLDHPISGIEMFGL